MQSPVVHRHCVLVAEDEAVLRCSLADDLREAGFITLEAANGEEALRVLELAHPIAVVVSDYELGGLIDGLAVAREAKRINPTIKVILVSGRQVPPTDGLYDVFIPKPYQTDKIVELVGRYLTRNNQSGSAIETG